MDAQFRAAIWSDRFQARASDAADDESLLHFSFHTFLMVLLRRLVQEGLDRMGSSD